MPRCPRARGSYMKYIVRGRDAAPATRGSGYELVEAEEVVLDGQIDDVREARGRRVLAQLRGPEDGTGAGRVRHVHRRRQAGQHREPVEQALVVAARHVEIIVDVLVGDEEHAAGREQ